MKTIISPFPGAAIHKRFLQLSFIVALLLVYSSSFSQTWTPLVTNTTEDLKCLQFLDANTGFAAGANGTIIKTIDGGANWSTLTSGVTVSLRTIYFLNQNIGWAAGDNGTIIKTIDGGLNWTPQNSGSTTIMITNIYFSDANNGWFTGSSSAIKKTTDGGNSWSPAGILPCGITGTIWGYEPISATDFWVCGSSHTVNHTTNSGTNWIGANSTFNPPPVLNSTTILEDIEFTDATHGWMVGGQGVIFYTTTGTPTAWTSIGVPPQSSELLSIDMVDQQNGWACGRNGAMVFTSGSGILWYAQASGTTQNLWEVDFVNATTGFAAGDGGTVIKYGTITSNAPITLLQPNGSEEYKVASTQSIIWNANSITNVKLEYSVNNGGNWSTIINSTPAAAGSYSWNVPNNISCNALVRITNASNPAVGDTSDAVFTISPNYVGKDYALEITATVSNSPTQIQLNWNSDPFSTGFTVDRKLKTDTTWTLITTLAGTATSYIDNTVAIGDAFEYRVTNNNCMLTSYGYIYAGVEFPETDFRGTILLLVDQNHAAALTNELSQYELDLIGDGYRINKKIIDPTIGVAAIKNIILQEYAIDNTISTVLSIGHLPAPYSGNFAPDGHPERIGAQPCDGYYGDTDGIWTDNSVTVSNTGTIYTPNVPGDGRFDHSSFPDEIDLQVGRIDMDKMTGFSNTESGLLQQYFQKNHNFRLKNTQPLNRAIMNTSMDQSLPNTSASAWRSYSAMFGNNILELNNCSFGCTDYVDSISTYSYLWSHMAGGGSDTSMQNDVFTSTHCINNPINSIFMQMYGSYFVEFYKGSISTQQNLLLRAPLASNGTALATVWSGRAPSWHFHHMALGETIGYSEKVNQNNYSTYEGGAPNSRKGVHMNLMGDPTLKMHIVAPVSNIVSVQNGTTVDISWSASTDNNIVGYNIYRADSLYGAFTRLNSSHIASTSFNDPNPVIGNNVYMVRAVKLENEASGSYYNLSTGLMDSLQVIPMGINELSMINGFTVFPNPASSQITISRMLNGYKITNALGELLMQSNAVTNFIPVENLPQGIYFIESENRISKFMIQK